MLVRPATDEDVARVVFAMRAADAFEVYSGRFDKTPQALVADFIALRPLAIGFLALCADEARAAALLGAWLDAPSRASVAMIATDEWPEISFAATRFAKRVAIPVFLSGVRSAECRAWEGNKVACRWLEALGFCCAARLPEHDEIGSTFRLYRWLRSAAAAPPPGVTNASPAPGYAAPA